MSTEEKEQMTVPTSKSRLSILENSLQKKKATLDGLFECHFADVKAANGQPLNDKCNGSATVNRWDRQSDRIRNAQLEIEKTEAAIDREKHKALAVDSVNKQLPQWLLPMVEAGELEQWKKHPNTFFVPGVESARIRIDLKTGAPCSILDDIPKDQYPKFRDTANKVIRLYNAERGNVAN